ncbi:hypothetical protein GTK09_03645 [Jiella sp. 40Bstr34]|uniref:DUF5666 domain-containing protein n=1 Tax=Jiella pacifica TaxID=2696469 RepID=A0A6N9SXJ8_9HYPH|nr:hypothetical protein [Jiella pacifica]
MLGLGAATAFLPAAFAQSSGQPERVRGTIESLEDTTLTVKSREGDSVAITLAPGYRITGIAKASVADIKEGDFVGVASVPGSSGGADAVEVLIFPKAMAGTGEGSYPWDLEPDSTMTNATVSNKVENADGRELTLTYPSGEKTVSLPEGIPIVTFAEATKADLEPGAPVFVPAQKASDGSISTAFVVVGNQGVVPPM